MNEQQMEGNWNQFKGKAKRVWGELTDDDFKKAEGSKDKLLGIVQEKFGDAKETAQRKIEKLGNS